MIKTKEPQLYDARTRRKAIIEITARIQREPNSVEVYFEDFARIESEEGPYRLLLYSGRKTLTKQQADDLFSQIKRKISASFIDFEHEATKHALLYYVQNDFIDKEKTKTIYGLNPEDWEIKK